MQIKTMLLAAVILLPVPAMAKSESPVSFFSHQYAGQEIELQPHRLAYDTDDVEVRASRRPRHDRAPVRSDPFRGAIADAVTRSAIEHGVPPALAHGVVRVESGYRCNLRDGIMQVLPRTARGVGVNGNMRSCATGLEAGMRYLRQAYVAARGNWCGAASLYNTGIGGSTRCNIYGRKVMRFAQS